LLSSARKTIFFFEIKKKTNELRVFYFDPLTIKVLLFTEKAAA